VDAAGKKQTPRHPSKRLLRNRPFQLLRPHHPLKLLRLRSSQQKAANNPDPQSRVTNVIASAAEDVVVAVVAAAESTAHRSKAARHQSKGSRMLDPLPRAEHRLQRIHLPSLPSKAPLYLHSSRAAMTAAIAMIVHATGATVIVTAIATSSHAAGIARHCLRRPIKRATRSWCR
jgi:hypothetical protein